MAVGTVRDSTKGYGESVYFSFIHYPKEGQYSNVFVGFTAGKPTDRTEAISVTEDPRYNTDPTRVQIRDYSGLKYGFTIRDVSRRGIPPNARRDPAERGWRDPAAAGLGPHGRLLHKKRPVF